MFMTGKMSVSTCSTANCPFGAGGQPCAAPARSFWFLPRGRAHRFWARDRSARLLLIAVPGGIEDYFGQINNAPDDGERHRIGERYGIRVLSERATEAPRPGP